ncbi:MAG: acyltransferase [Planctomycetales bacterium]|nr:acyltransferase [Planctomycetales bacterium]
MRELLKRTARAIAMVLVFPSVLSFRLRARIIGADRALQGSSQFWSLFPGISGAYLRTGFYRQVLAECHPTVWIEFGVLFSSVKAELGENVYIGPRCHLGWVRIEKDVLIAPAVQIPSGPHTHGTSDPDKPYRKQAGSPKQVTIHVGAWLGANAVVMGDVGERAIVGAGAIVVAEVESRALVAGVRARCLRQYGDGKKK